MSTSIVSVCVFTFNSAKTIIQTLNSVYEQTYANIELIISDDFSSDETLEICKEWLLQHESRFVNVQLLTVDYNTGTTANTNRAYHASKGYWVKPIAGDDLLKPYAIEKYVDYLESSGHQVCVTLLDYFGNPERIFQKRVSYTSFYNKYKTMDREQRYRYLLSECALPMPSMMISKELLSQINYADESYPFSEEWPTYMRIFDAGYDIPYLSEPLVEYRCENDCLSIGANYNDSIKGQTYKIARQKVFNDGYRFYKEYRRPQLIKLRMLYAVWAQDTSYKIIIYKTKEGRSVLDCLKLYFYRFISPMTYRNIYEYFMKSTTKELKKKIGSFFGY